jgi:hypothetical protein
MKTLKCSKCKKYKSRSKFFKRKTPRGFGSQCIFCRNIRHHVYRRLYRQKLNARRKNWWKKFRTGLLEMFGNKCSKCGISDPRVLQIDHKNGGGNKERKKFGTSQIYYRIIKKPQNYQLLCANCNWIKHVEGKGTFAL